MLFSVFPFNLLKHGVTSLVTWLIYKRVGNTLRAMLAERGYPCGNNRSKTAKWNALGYL